MATMDITPTRAPPMATTGLTTLLAECSLAPDPGSTDSTARAITVTGDADGMATVTVGAAGSAEKADGMAMASVETRDFMADPSKAVAFTAETPSMAAKAFTVETPSTAEVASMVAEALTVEAAGSTVDVAEP